MPEIDFSAFGPVEEVALSRNQHIGGGFLARNWAQIPHVTHHDEAPCDAVDAFRRAYADHHGIKLTPLPLVIKAVVAALHEHPRFNASLSSDGATLVLKKYFHIGVAVETPHGLVVAVIRDCDRKSVAEIAEEISEKAERARTRGLPYADMTGGSFSISSLGNIGGTAFTPIINAPEVAILGLTRSATRLDLVDGQVRARTVLPLSLSYDHRVINGADAARFCRSVSDLLQNPSQLDRQEPQP